MSSCVYVRVFVVISFGEHCLSLKYVAQALVCPRGSWQERRKSYVADDKHTLIRDEERTANEWTTQKDKRGEKR